MTQVTQKNHTNDTTLTTVKFDMLKIIHINFALFGHHTKIECSKFKLKIITPLYVTLNMNYISYISLTVH